LLPLFITAALLASAPVKSFPGAHPIASGCTKPPIGDTNQTAFSFMVDHYVAILKVTDSAVIVGDPLNGLESISADEIS
jgi:hypothetical protein